MKSGRVLNLLFFKLDKYNRKDYPVNEDTVYLLFILWYKFPDYVLKVEFSLYKLDFYIDFANQMQYKFRSIEYPLFWDFSYLDKFVWLLMWRSSITI